jgi:hypothetical protein
MSKESFFQVRIEDHTYRFDRICNQIATGETNARVFRTTCSCLKKIIIGARTHENRIPNTTNKIVLQNSVWIFLDERTVGSHSYSVTALEFSEMSEVYIWIEKGIHLTPTVLNKNPTISSCLHPSLTFLARSSYEPRVKKRARLFQL